MERFRNVRFRLWERFYFFTVMEMFKEHDLNPIKDFRNIVLVYFKNF